MITTAIFNLIYWTIYLVLAPIRALGDATLPAGFSAAIATIGGYLGAVNDILPVYNLLIIFGLIISIEGFILLYKGVMWIIRRIPAQG